jgi:hypothetical protein
MNATKAKKYIGIVMNGIAKQQEAWTIFLDGVRICLVMHLGVYLYDLMDNLMIKDV